MIHVTCGDPYCRRWATFYTTKDANPDFTRIEYGVAEGSLLKFWYACSRHKGPAHVPLAADAVVPPVCEHCGSTDRVSFVGSMTAYHYEETVWDILLYGPGETPNPNRDKAYCPSCAEEHVAYWTEMWDEFRSMQGI